MPATFYKIIRIFWSIYFVLSIAIIGFFFGYLATFFCYLVSWLLKLVSARASLAARNFGEYIQCYSIRMLLKLQPWLNCSDNFHTIYNFFKPYNTRKVMFVANHRSNLDTFLMISFVPGLSGLAKKSLYQNIFFAPFMMAMGFVPVEKGNVAGFIQGLKGVRQKILDRNRPVLIFPENTRCPKGFPSLQKFSSAIFKMAIESQALIIPVAIRGTDQVLGRGDLFLYPHRPVEVKMLKPVAASQFEDSEKLSLLVWNQLAQAIQ